MWIFAHTCTQEARGVALHALANSKVQLQIVADHTMEWHVSLCLCISKFCIMRDIQSESNLNNV